uniref:ANF_receptor domain-containing protein n=1 Tax=Parastrongyloides trichosuri TaxID=131310 RepID=A0A0N5A2C3_PARTI
MYPCFYNQCPPPETQISTIVDNIKNNNLTINTLWIVVDSSNWSYNTTINQKLINTLVLSAQSLGQNVGIFTNIYGWQRIAYFKIFIPLRWDELNGIQNYANFQEFGGWTKPSMHLYTFLIDRGCGTDIDISWSY